MLSTGIGSQSCPNAYQWPITKALNELSYGVGGKLIHPKHHAFMSYAYASDMENGRYIKEERQPFVNAMRSSHGVGYTAYGACATQGGEQNSSFPIEDVQKLQSWFKTAQIILPVSCIQEFFKIGIEFLAEIVKKLGFKGEIAANQESNSNRISAADTQESAQFLSKAASFPDGVTDELDESIKKSAEQGFNNDRAYRLSGASVLNSACNLYCVARKISTPIPALFTFLIGAATFANSLTSSSESEISKELKSSLEKISRRLSTVCEEVNILKESALPQEEERTIDQHNFESGRSSAFAIESYTKQARVRQNSTTSNVSDITLTDW